MIQPILGAVNDKEILLVAVVFILAFVFLLAGFFTLWWYKKKEKSISIYSGRPLRLLEELPIMSLIAILKFLYEKKSVDNRIFDFTKATICRQTGRVFQDTVLFLGVIRLDWSFFQKKCPGNFVSWGSLEIDQKIMIKESHGSLKGFQTDFSCENPSPQQITEEYIYTKPGPLYVDLHSRIVMGWQEVPDTEFEVLIVQRPLKMDYYHA